MKRTDYIRIAEAVRASMPTVSQTVGSKSAASMAVYDVADSIARALKADNEAFNRIQFMTACGFGDAKGVLDD